MNKLKKETQSDAESDYVAISKDLELSEQQRQICQDLSDAAKKELGEEADKAIKHIVRYVKYLYKECVDEEEILEYFYYNTSVTVIFLSQGYYQKLSGGLVSIEFLKS